jgi:protein ImuB
MGDRHYMCIYFPEWSIDVTRRALRARAPHLSPKALLLTSRALNQIVIARACQRARALGVRETMSYALAKALVPDETHVETFDPVRDAQALHTLAVWFGRFSPIVGVDSELHQQLHSKDPRAGLSSLDPRHYGIALDLTGTERVHGDRAALCDRINSLLQGARRIAIGPTLSGAWALSRYAPTSPYIVRTLTELSAHVSHLPVQALRIDDTTRKKLADVGVRTIGDLDQFPRVTLGQRFGKQLLCRLSQLYGGISEQIHTVAPQPTYRERATFEPPLTHRNAIVTAIENLFARIIASLSKSHAVAKLFLLAVRDTEGHVVHKELSLASATNDAAHLRAIVYPIVEGLRFCGEVSHIAIEAREIARTSTAQTNFHSESSPDPEAVSQAYGALLNSFAVRLGKDRILKTTLTASHIPERSFRYHSEVLRPSTLPAALAESSHHYGLDKRSAAAPPPPPPLASPYVGPLDRPPVLLSPPEPIISIAMLPDRPPSWIRWRGATLTITYGIGPERIAPEWWRQDPQHETQQEQAFCERDYFTVQDDAGRWLWVFRRLDTQEWFVHGVWR